MAGVEVLRIEGESETEFGDPIRVPALLDHWFAAPQTNGTRWWMSFIVLPIPA